MKTRTNVSIDKNTLEEAKANNIVLSALLEKAVKNELARLAEEAWKEKNKKTISAYNKYVTRKGVFSDDIRTF